MIVAAGPTYWDWRDYAAVAGMIVIGTIFWIYWSLTEKDAKNW